MIEIIMSYVVKTVFVALSLFLYVFLIACVFPKLFLCPSYKTVRVRDRGLKKYVFDQGRAIAYEPAPSMRKYISQYILSENCGEKFIKCKVDDRIDSLRYDVVVFGADDKVLDTVEVYEAINGKGITRAAALPLSTAYVSVCVREVNGVHVTEDATASFSAIKVALFFILTACCTVAMALMLNSLILYFADLLLRYTARYGAVGNTFTLLSSLVLSVLYCSVVWICHRTKDTKIVK